MNARRREYVSYSLVAVAIGLGAVVFLDRDRPTTKEQDARAGMLLRVFRDEDVTRITIQRKGGEKIELVREGDIWKMSSPRTNKVDPLAVAGFMNTLRGARAIGSVGEAKGGDRVQFGLDAPRSTVEIAMKGITLNLALGAPSTGGVADDAGVAPAYVEVAPYADQKGGVFKVEPDVVAVLDRSADAYREPSLTGHLSSQYSKLDVAGIVHLDRGEHGTWRVAGGVRADPDAADGLFLALYEMKAAPFVPDDTPIDIAKGGTVTATLIEGGTLVVAFGGECTSKYPLLVVAQARGTTTDTGCVHPTITDRIRWPLDKYFDEHAFGLIHGTTTVKTSEIELVVVESAGKKVLDAERRGDGLHMRAPSELQVDKESTDRYLARLAGVAGPIVKSPDLPALGLSPPAGKVTIRRVVEARNVGDGGSIPWEQVVEIGTPDLKERVIHLRRLDDGAVLRVPLEIADPILAGAAASMQSPNLIDLNVESVTRVYAHPESEIAWDLHRSGSVWEMKIPTGLGTDPSLAQAIATDLATLGCLRSLEKDDGTFGAVHSTIDVERTVPTAVGDGGTPPTTFTIELGSPAKDGIPARIKGNDRICVLPAGKVASLFRAPFDVRNPSFEPSAHGKRWVFTHDKSVHAIVFDETTKTWNESSDAGSSIIARKLGDLGTGLRAVSIVHLGAAKPEEGFVTPTLIIEGFDGATKKKTLRIGGAGPGSTMFARVDGTDATYTIAKSEIDEMLKNL